jgi:hypothetical protein
VAPREMGTKVSRQRAAQRGILEVMKAAAIAVEMSAAETHEAIELGFRIAFYVLLGLSVLSGALLAGVFLSRSERFWRWYRIPIAVTAAMISGLSLGIIGYFVLMLCVLDRTKSPVDYFPGYDGSGLVAYGGFALFALVCSLSLWAVLLCGKAKSSPS